MPYALVSRLLLSSLVIPFFYFLILMIGKCLRHHLTSRARYHLWFLFLFVLAVPFLQFIHTGTRLWNFSQNLLGPLFSQTKASLPGKVYETAASGSNLFTDFSISVICRTPAILPTILLILWITGMVIMTILTLFTHYKIKQRKKSSLLLQNERVRVLYESCLKEANIRRTIPIYSSAYVTSPIAIGFLSPSIIVPIHILSEMPEKDLRHILLHELIHCKHKDLIMNQFMALAQILYWFHPVVWMALKRMQNDREIACDSSVLSMLPSDQYLDYGNTLINFAESLSRFPYCTTGMGGSKKEIRNRIISIASYKGESRWHKRKSSIIVTSCALVVAFVSSFLSAGATYDGNYKFHGGNINKLELDSSFQGHKGSFVLYELNSGRYSIYNESQGTKRISPDSTYKIYSALVALEEGVIAPTSSSLFWNGVTYPFQEWNKNQTLDSAMKCSANWYFAELDKCTGLSSLKTYFKTMGYGNSDVSGGLGRFWAESTLKISPVEQVELLTKFYQGKLDFAPENQKAVKDSLFVSSSNGAFLYGKTGTGDINGKQVNGWFIGFVETKDETYVFATNIQDTQSASGSAAAKITLDILKNRNIYTE